MNLKEWNESQIKESLSDINRYYYWKHTGKDGITATPDELLMFYIEFGAKIFSEKHQQERD